MAGQVQGTQPFSPGDDFSLCIRRFEAYAQAVKIKDEMMCDALLALLDDAVTAFRVVDLLGLEEVTRSDFKLLTDALRQRFAPSAGHQELMFALSQREQEPSKTLDDYVHLLIQWNLS